MAVPEVSIRARIQDAAELKRQVRDLWSLDADLALSLSDSVDRERIADEIDALAELFLAEAGRTLLNGLDDLERLTLTDA